MRKVDVEKTAGKFLIRVYLERVPGIQRWYIYLYLNSGEERELVAYWPEDDLGHKGELTLTDQYNICEWLQQQGVEPEFLHQARRAVSLAREQVGLRS